MKCIDLHVHSTISDGTLTPSELILYAKSKDLAAIALTDHDTIAGIDECITAGRAENIGVIPGIEFSADYYGKEVHVLGYYIDHHSPILSDKLTALLSARARRNEAMLHKLSELGMPITLNDCLKDTDSSATITRAHIAKALLEKGYIKDRAEAFAHYIGDGKPAFVPKEKFTVAECTKLIHELGGLAVLAHPLLYGYDYQDLNNILKGMVNEGIDGLECLYATHSKEDTAFLLQCCLRHKLFPTGGSDFHGANKPGLDLGSGYGELMIPFELLHAMQERLSHLNK